MQQSTSFLQLLPYTPPSWAASLSLVPTHRYHLGLLPTPVHRWRPPGVPDGVELWIKRDDLSGMQMSGNKVRKLEFLMADARRSGADCVVTIGGIQSNHARATAVAARYLGLPCHLILRNTRAAAAADPGLVGNLLVSRLAGAVVHQVTKEEYAAVGSEALTAQLAAQLAAQGRQPYVVPVGGSSALGTWGYLQAVEEVTQQSSAMGVRFDDIVVACGSGGTIAGWALGNHLAGLGARIHAYGVCDDPDYFYDYVDGLFRGLGGAAEGVHGRDTFAARQAKGAGYAISHPEELQTVRDVALATGVVLDPVYSGKAAHFLFADMQAQPERWLGRRVLFVHTGGLLGMYDKLDQLQPLVEELGTAQRMERGRDVFRQRSPRWAATSPQQQQQHSYPPHDDAAVPVTIVLSGGGRFTTSCVIRRGSTVAEADAVAAMPAAMAFTELMGGLAALELDGDSDEPGVAADGWWGGVAPPRLHLPPPVRVPAAALALATSAPPAPGIAQIRPQQGPADVPSSAAAPPNQAVLCQRLAAAECAEDLLSTLRARPCLPRLTATGLAAALHRLRHLAELHSASIRGQVGRRHARRRQPWAEAVPSPAAESAQQPAWAGAGPHALTACLQELQPDLRRCARQLSGSTLESAAVAAGLLRWQGADWWAALREQADDRPEDVSVCHGIRIAAAAAAAAAATATAATAAASHSVPWGPTAVASWLERHTALGAAGSNWGPLRPSDAVALVRLLAPALKQGASLPQGVSAVLDAAGGPAACSPADACRLLGALAAAPRRAPLSRHLLAQLLRRVAAGVDAWGPHLHINGIEPALVAAARWRLPGGRELTVQVLAALQGWCTAGDASAGQPSPRLGRADVIVSVLRSCCLWQVAPSPCMLAALVHALAHQLLWLPPGSLAAARGAVQQLGGDASQLLQPSLQRCLGAPVRELLSRESLGRTWRLVVGASVFLDPTVPLMPRLALVSSPVANGCGAGGSEGAQAGARQLLLRIGAHAMEEPSALQPLADAMLVDLAWAAARCGAGEAGIAGAVLQQLSGRHALERLSAAPAARLAWALAVAQVPPTEGAVGTLAANIAANASQLSARDAAAAACAFAILRFPHTGLYTALSERLCPLLWALSAHDLAAVAVAMVQAGWVPARLMLGLAQRLVSMMGQLQGPEVAQVVWAYGVAGFHHERLTASAMQRLDEVQGGITEQVPLQEAVFGLRQLGAGAAPITQCLAQRLAAMQDGAAVPLAGAVEGSGSAARLQQGPSQQGSNQQRQHKTHQPSTGDDPACSWRPLKLQRPSLKPLVKT